MWPAGCQSWVRMTWSKRVGQIVEVGDDLVAFGDSEGASGEEVVLHVDDEEDVGRQERHDDWMVEHEFAVGRSWA